MIEGNWWFLNLVVDSNKNPPNKTLPFLWQRQAQLQFADKIDSEAYPKVDLWISWGLFLSETPQELGEFFSHFSHCEHYVMHMIKTSSNTPENLSFLVKVCYDDLTLDALLKEISNDRKLLESTLSKEMHHLCKVLISHEPPVSYKRRKMSTDFVCNPQVLYQNEKQVTLSFLRVLLKSNIRENVPWYVNSFLQEFANFDEESQGLLVSSLIHESLKLFRQDPNRYIYWSKFFNDVLLGIDDASLQKGLASFKQDREQSIQLKFDYYLQGDLNKIVKEKIESRSV